MRPTWPGPETVRPVVVDEPHDRPERRAPGGSGRGAQVLGRGERRPCDLGRSVEVVELVADRALRAADQLGLELGPRRNTIRSELVSQRPGSASSSDTIRESITGTTTSAVGRSRAIASSTASGLKRRCTIVVQPRIIDRTICVKPEAVEHRRGDVRRLRRPVGHLRQQRTERMQRTPLMARRALRGAGRAAGQQHDVRRLRRVGGGTSPAWRGDQLLERVGVDVVVGPREHAPADAAQSSRPDPRTRRRGRAAPRPRARTRLSSCGPAKSVFRYSIRVPSRPAANVTSMNPRWLRHRIPTVSPSRRPRARSADASAIERSLSWANVSIRARRSARAGRRSAPPAISIAAPI